MRLRQVAATSNTRSLYLKSSKSGKSKEIRYDVIKFCRDVIIRLIGLVIRYLLFRFCSKGFNYTMLSVHKMAPHTHVTNNATFAATFLICA